MFDNATVRQIIMAAVHMEQFTMDSMILRANRVKPSNQREARKEMKDLDCLRFRTLFTLMPH